MRISLSLSLLLLLAQLNVSCGNMTSHHASSVKVTNGQPVGDHFPAVVKLVMQLPEGLSSCTGTFVNDAQVVTAAHCMYAVKKAGVGVDAISFERSGPEGNVSGEGALAYVFFKEYREVPGVLSNQDLAVVTFPHGSAPATVPLFKGMPHIGDQFVIVGFGANDYALDGSKRYGGAGVKRAGSNVIKSFSGNMIQFDGIPVAGTNIAPLGRFVASGAGDSGGPLFIGGALAAVTSGGGLHVIQDRNGKKWPALQSSYVSISVPENSDFLRRQLTFGWY